MLLYFKLSYCGILFLFELAKDLHMLPQFQNGSTFREQELRSELEKLTKEKKKIEKKYKKIQKELATTKVSGTSTVLNIFILYFIIITFLIVIIGQHVLEQELENSRKVSEEQLTKLEMHRMELEMALEIALAQQAMQEEIQYP